MPKVQAWQCPETGKLFPIDRTDRYLKHLRKTAKQRILARKRKKAEETFVDRRNEFWRTAMTFQDIADFIVANPSEIFVQCDEFRRCDHMGRERPTPPIERVTFVNMIWDECVSNTHNAPNGKPTNWHRKIDLPHGYPGWRGQIMLEYQRKHNNQSHFGSEGLARWGIHTGSGGGGSTAHRYSVIIFAEEFVNIAFNFALMRPPK